VKTPSSPALPVDGTRDRPDLWGPMTHAPQVPRRLGCTLERWAMTNVNGMLANAKRTWTAAKQRWTNDWPKRSRSWGLRTNATLTQTRGNSQLTIVTASTTGEPPRVVGGACGTDEASLEASWRRTGGVIGSTMTFTTGRRVAVDPRWRVDKEAR